MKKKRFSLIFSVVVFCGMILPGGMRAEEVMEKIEVRSPAFSEGDSIPREFACDGANMSPPIEWSGVPSHAQSIAIIADDPDAPSGDWVHWVLYDLPPSLTGIPAGVPVSEKLPAGGTQGRTDFGKIGYGGPCPPKGTHRYFFKIYALDTMLHSKSGMTKKELLNAMQGHVLAEGQLMGKYRRS